MPVSVQCTNPACGKFSVAREELLGKRVKCKSCGGTFLASPTVDGAKSDTFSGQPAPLVPAKAPQRIGRFEVRAKLGQGAFGTVFRAYDPQLDREVALKVPNPGTLDSPKRVERFLREAKAAAGLRHPHIVPVFDAGQDEGRYYIASAFIKGQKLADTFAEAGTGLERAARLVRELCEALAYAHEQGIVHRDVKPDNIMLDSEDRVHLMDFGLASRQDDEAKLTSDGAVMGTPSYMAPEQARGQEGEAKPAADQYSAGVVLYELLTGRVPFEGPPAIVIHNQVHTEPEKPTRWRRDIPRDLETICLKALAKRPEDRYRSCGAMAADLRRWLDDEPVAARQPGALERLGRWVKRNKAVAALSAAVALSLGIGVVVAGYLALVAGQEADRANRKAEEADENAGKAEREAKAAREAEGVARAAQGKAQKEATRAEQEKQAADKEWRRAEEELARSERLVYVGRLSQAQLSLQDGYADGALAALSDCQWDLRGWEHRYLSMRCGISESRRTFAGHTGLITSVSFSPDGKRVLSASTDGTARVWDTDSGKLVVSLDGHGNRRFSSNGGVRAAAFSADGKKIATAGSDGTARVWDAATGKEMLVIRASAPVRSELGVRYMAFSRDGKRIATIVDKGSASEGKVWDAETGREAFALPLKGSRSRSHGIAFSPDGKRVLTGGPNRTLQVTDASGKSTPLGITLSGSLYAAGYSPDGGKGFVVTTDGVLTVWRENPKGISPQDLVVMRNRVDGIVSAAFSHDGTRIVTGSGYGKAQVWDATTGKELAAFKCVMQAVMSVAFSPDGKAVLTGGMDNSVKLWDASTSADDIALKRHDFSQQGQYGAALDPEGRRVVAVVAGGAVVRDAKTGRDVFSLKGHADSVEVVAYSGNGKRILTLGKAVMKLWDADTGKELFSSIRDPKMDSGAVFLGAGVALSPDGKRVVASSGGKVKVWDAENGREILAFEGQVSPSRLAMSGDGKSVAAGALDRRSTTDDRKTTTLHPTWTVWDATTGRQRVTVKEEDGVTPGQLMWAALSPDGHRLFTAVQGRSAPYKARLWDVMSGRELFALEGQGGHFVGLAFSPDGRRLLTGKGDWTVGVWDAANGQELLALKRPWTYRTAIMSLAMSRDGKRLMSSGLSGSLANVTLWRGEGEEVLRLPLRGRGSIASGAFSPDGKFILTGMTDGTARLWDAVKGRAIRSFKVSEHPVQSVAFSPDGKRFVTGSVPPAAGKGGRVMPGEAKIWETETGRLVFSLKEHLGGVAYSPDGKRIATVNGKGGAVWSAEDGKLLHPLVDHEAAIVGLAFCPDSKRIVTVSPQKDPMMLGLLFLLDEKARLWDPRLAAEPTCIACGPGGRIVLGTKDGTAKIVRANTREEGRLLKGHTGEILSVAASRDGKRVVTGGADRTARLWDLETGKELRVLRDQFRGVDIVSFSPDGKRVFVGSGGGAWVWDLGDQ